MDKRFQASMGRKGASIFIPQTSVTRCVVVGVTFWGEFGPAVAIAFSEYNGKIPFLWMWCGSLFRNKKGTRSSLSRWEDGQYAVQR